MSKTGSDFTYLVVISMASALKEDENYEIRKRF